MKPFRWMHHKLMRICAGKVIDGRIAANSRLRMELCNQDDRYRGLMHERDRLDQMVSDLMPRIFDRPCAFMPQSRAIQHLGVCSEISVTMPAFDRVYPLHTTDLERLHDKAFCEGFADRFSREWAEAWGKGIEPIIRDAIIVALAKAEAAQ